jgi:hypothetical protein
MSETRLTLLCTTACSPKTMTFPGAETMKAGIIGLEYLRSSLGVDGLFVPFIVGLLPLPPLGCGRGSPFRMPLTLLVMTSDLCW